MVTSRRRIAHPSEAPLSVPLDAPAPSHSASATTSPRMNTATTSASGTSPSCFRVTTASNATTLTDGVELVSFDPASGKRRPSHHPDAVVLPWLGFGTYRLGSTAAVAALRQALECGYRSIDTAFIYSGETTERHVGQVLREALQQPPLLLASRQHVFVTTKHWRKYHGYEPTLQCLKLSLQRLQLDSIDLWLMHWPGPAWTTMHRRLCHDDDPWHYAAATMSSAEEMVRLRAETWRAMEEAVRLRQVRAIGVSNMTVRHLEELKKTAQLWPPAVNQVEFHPLFPQTELLEYCRKEGIVLQAYASLGGQDTGKKGWTELLGKQQHHPAPPAAAASTPELGKRKRQKSKDMKPPSLLNSPAVLELAHELSVTHQIDVTPAQVLLRWGLEQGAVLIPKTTSRERLLENAGVFHCSMTPRQVTGLRDSLLATVRSNHPDCEDVQKLTRLCWRKDPLRLLDFD